MVALVRSTLNWARSSWYEIVAALSVVASDEPCFQALIHPALVLLSDISPPLQDWQLEHATLAVMVDPSSLTPLPARRVNFAAVLLVSSWGSECPVPSRGDKVTLSCPSWYIRKMLESVIPDPVPNAAH
jgi:hypothetical protein